MGKIKAYLQDFEEGRYEGFWDGAHMALLNELEKQIVSRLIPPSAAWFIDIGCGEGRLFSQYAASAKEIILLDYTMASLVRAEKKFSTYGNVHLIAADVRYLPFRNSVIDAGLCIRMVNNYPVIEETIQELSRIFAPSATLVISYFNRRNLLRALKYGRDCFDRVHKFEFKGTAGLMCATHPVFFDKVVRRFGFHIKSNCGAGFGYQLSSNSRKIQFLIARQAAMRRLFRFAGGLADYVLGKSRLALWQFVQLKKGASKDNCHGLEALSLADLLQCPRCRRGGIDLFETKARCLSCGAFFKRKGKIYDFRLAD